MADMNALFRPFDDGHLSLANRVVMAPMTRSRSPAGIPGPGLGDYYARRAAAQVGLILTEGLAIERAGALDDPNVPHFWGEALESWRAVADQVHAAGGKIMPQLWHVGARAGRRSAWTENDPRIESPSGLQAPGVTMGRAMDDADIADTIRAYADGARNARDLGFDGVEIHGAHGYLIDQFLWPTTNERTDRYGGKTLAERTRFAVEIVRAMREAVGGEFPISFRFSLHRQQETRASLAHDPAELAILLEPLAGAGVTIFHGSQANFWEPVFAGSHLNLAGWAKKLTGCTSISVGSVGLSGEFASNFRGEVSEPTSLDQLLERLDREEFDLIAVGRALLNDPHWAEKVAAGRSDELKPFGLKSLETYF